MGPAGLGSPEVDDGGLADSLLSTLTDEAVSVFEAALGRVLDEGIDQNVEVDFVLPSGRRRRPDCCVSLRRCSEL